MTEEQNRMMVYWMEQTLAGYVHEGNNLEATKLRIQLEPFQKREAERQEKVLRAQQLFTAIKTGDMDTFNKLLKEEIDINQEESIDRTNPNWFRKEALTPLIIAIQNQQFEMVKLLLLKDSIDPNKQYPLHALTTIEHNRNCTFQQRKQISEAVQLLVDHPEINVNIQDDNGCTPLVYAVDGMEGAEASAARKHLASKLAAVWNCKYSQMCSFVKARLSFALVQAIS